MTGIAALLGTVSQQIVKVADVDLLVAFVANPDAFVAMVDAEGIALAFGFSTFGTAIARMSSCRVETDGTSLAVEA